MLGMVGNHEPDEGVEGGEPGVARGDAVVALRFQGCQEPLDPIGRDVRDVQGLDRAPEAFVGMLRGDNLGKALVTLG